MAVDEDAEQEYVPQKKKTASDDDERSCFIARFGLWMELLFSLQDQNLEAMKVENMLKIKEEFDYKSLSRRLETQLDKLIAENERQQKAFEDEIERVTLEAQSHVSEAERNFVDALEVFLGLVDHEKESIKSRAGNTPI
ncbi:Kinesin-like protein KIN-UA [Camellia lanceoleosa]|uniref:Kinesin-like protein KIN-UA n=1 Tax=Camellia lanceoleosa TaxID=1840588 RepID=A0ACC0GFZ1_9ERIC|nr:Kinesin-like protein KIN-UA [Camellia lanceoleosa]